MRDPRFDQPCFFVNVPRGAGFASIDFAVDDVEATLRHPSSVSRDEALAIARQQAARILTVRARADKVEGGRMAG